MMNRAEKFRQAAFAYLLVGVLYEGAAYAMWQRGILPPGRGPGWLWMLVGAAIVSLVVWGLWKWQNVWFARVIWVIHALRVPTLIGHAFFPTSDQRIAAGFYLTALVVVVANLWMLGRAAWDV
jgi:hypothetical protein